MKNNKFITMAFESSCDETAIAVLADGREVLSNVISSQIDIFKNYGGVVPEIAARHHLENINEVVDEALAKADVTMDDVDLIAVTEGPGLVGALLIGVATAKAMAFACDKPIIGVHHIMGHVSANYIEFPDLEPPFTALIASGGHTNIAEVKNYTEVEIIGGTRDDAIGEAYDKVARVLGLGYPGGPKVDKLAREGNEDLISFKKTSFGKDNFDFSFSGIKTGVINYLHNAEQKGETVNKADLAAGFQRNVVETLVDNLLGAADKAGVKKVALAGGVACNSRLRQELEKRKDGFDIFYPEPILCTDNAAMIACSGYYEMKSGKNADLSLNAIPFLAVDLK